MFRRAAASWIPGPLLLILFVAASTAASELSDAKKLLRSRDANERRRGVQALIRIDSRAAIQPMEEAVRQSRRAMAKLEKEIDKADEALGAAISLCVFAERRSNASFLRYALDKLKEVRAAWDVVADEMDANLFTGRDVGEGFARFRSHGAIKLIERGASSEPDAYLRQLYVQALGAAQRPRSIPILLELLDSRDARTRAVAARALRPFVLDKRVLARLPALAADKSWSVRLGMYETMARAPFEIAVPCLVRAAVHEEGQMAVTADGLLQDLTGRSFSQTPKAWEHWLEKNREAIDAGTYAREATPKTAETPTRSTFFRVPISSTNVLFAIDFSGSMTDEFVLNDVRSNQVRAELELPETRFGIACSEAIRAIRALPEGALFNVVIYGSEAETLSARPLKASKSTRRRAQKWILKQKASGLTNIWDALRQSFGDHLANTGGRSRFKLLPDTIVFLTDGHPTRGRFQRTEGIRELVSQWNAAAGTVIHTVGIGEDHAKGLLERLAADNFGFYVDLSKGEGGLRNWRRQVPVEERRPNFKKLLTQSRILLEKADRAGRVAALRLLATMGSHAAPLTRLIAKGLDSVFEDEAAAATDALVVLGADAVPHIMKYLDAEDEVTVQTAIDALRRLGMDAAPALGRLIQFAVEGPAEFRVPALRAIASMGPAATDAEEALKVLCDSKDEEIAAAAEKALGEIRDG